MDARKNEGARGIHARGEEECLPRARPFFLAQIYFLASATQAISGHLATNEIATKHCFEL